MPARRATCLKLCGTGLCLLLGGGGCLRVAPKLPRTLGSPAPLAYSPAAFDADVSRYRTALSAADQTAARTQRDAIVYRVLAQVDAAYGAFEVNLNVRRAGAQTGADAAQLGLTAAATVTGASGVKDILSATATALGGTRLSFDKNYFEQKTTESLVSQMRASRLALKAQLLLNLAKRDVSSYPLEAAWVDLIGYYYAGTIPSALVEIANRTGSDAVRAGQDLQDVVRELRPATPAQAEQSLDVRAAYDTLSRGISAGRPDEVVRSNDALRRILREAGIAFEETASPADLLARMRDAMAAAAEDPTLSQRLADAVRSAMRSSRKETP